MGKQAIAKWHAPGADRDGGPRYSEAMNAFVDRRARLAQALRAAGGGVAVIPTAPERQRNNDNDHPYRHDSSFHHLTGFGEPGAWLVLTDSGESTLLCREKDPAMEIWDGLRLGPAAAPAALGVSSACDIATLASVNDQALRTNVANSLRGSSVLTGARGGGNAAASASRLTPLNFTDSGEP